MKTTRTKLAVTIGIVMAVMMVTTVGFSGRATVEAHKKDHAKTAFFEAWVVEHEGAFTLARQLKKEVRRGLISEQQAAAAFISTRNLTNELRFAFAKKFKKNRDLKALQNDIRTATEVTDNSANRDSEWLAGFSAGFMKAVADRKPSEGHIKTASFTRGSVGRQFEIDCGSYAEGYYWGCFDACGEACDCGKLSYQAWCLCKNGYYSEANNACWYD